MRTCATCGIAKSETGFYPGKRHCKVCLLADRRARYRSDEAMRNRLIAHARKVSEAESGRLLARDCSLCGERMKKRSRDGLPGVCAECKWRNGYKVKISKAARLAIYERDGWRCGICSESVDPAVHGNTLWGATLDHIHPRSRGGTDEPSNLRLAHRYCNSVRRDSVALTLDELAA